MAKKFLTDINIAGGVYDSSGDIGNSGQVLSSTGSGVNWINANSAASVVYQDGFTGNGSTTAFTLANSIDNENKTQVYIDGVYQHKDNYSLSGTTLTFSTAPPNSSDIEVISFSSVSSADDILYDTDFGSAGLMTTNGSGVYSITTNNSANWNTAYTYSQVGHLPLAGGTLTGNVTFSSTTTFNDDITLNVAKLLKSSNNAASNFLDFDDDSTTHNPDSNVTTLASVSGIAMATNLNDGGGGAFTVSTGSTGTRLLTITTAGDATFARDVTVGRNLAADSGTVSHRLRSSTTTAAVLQVRPLGTRTGITPIIQYRQTETGGIKYLMAGTGGTYFGNYNSGIPTDASSMIRLSSDNSNNPSIGIGDSGSGTAHLDIGGNVLITNSGNSYFNGGNVGIGTTTPGSRRLNIATSDSGNDVGFESTISRTSGSNYGIRGLANGSGATTNIGGFFEASGATTNRALWAYVGHVLLATQNTNDYVGIGTESPDYKLDVAGEIGLDSYLRHNGDSNTFFGFSGNDEIKFRTAGSDRIFINSSGNVGIGNTSPDAFLHIGGAPAISAEALIVRGNANGQYAVSIEQDNSSGFGMVIDTDSTDSSDPAFKVQNPNGSLLDVRSDGNVGIGTTSPQTYLQIGDYPSNNIDITTYPDVPSEHMIHLSAPETTNSYGAGISFGENSFTAANITVQDAGANGALHMLFGTRHTSGTVQERMRITSGGNIIFGNAGPQTNVPLQVDYSGGNASLWGQLNQTMYFNARPNGTAEGMAFQINGSTDMFLRRDGNVGIGTTSPQSPLQVNADIYSSIRLGSDYNYSVNREWRFITNNFGSGNWGGIALQQSTAQQGNTFATKFGIDVNGNVGIGNSNPLAKLQITSGDSGASSPWSNADELILESSGNAGLAFQTPNTGAATIAFQDPESVQAGFIQYLHADNALRFATNGNNERMRIDSSGNVGIGTTAPSEKLQVNGNIRVAGVGNSIGFDTTGALLSNGIKTINDYETVIYNDRGSAGFAVIGNSNIRLGFGTNYTNAETDLFINSSGNVGIGTTSPSRKLDVNGEITHEGLVPKAGAFVDGLVTINKTVSTSANTWTSLDISLSNIGGSGTFAVQVYSNAHGSTGGAWYNMYWSGIMSWYHSSTNDDDIDEIPLHMAGHARNNNTLELRTKLHTADGSSYANRCELQIKTANALSSAPISFRFRKLL